MIKIALLALALLLLAQSAITPYSQNHASNQASQTPSQSLSASFDFQSGNPAEDSQQSFQDNQLPPEFNQTGPGNWTDFNTTHVWTSLNDSRPEPNRPLNQTQGQGFNDPKDQNRTFQNGSRPNGPNEPSGPKNGSLQRQNSNGNLGRPNISSDKQGNSFQGQSNSNQQVQASSQTRSSSQASQIVGAVTQGKSASSSSQSTGSSSHTTSTSTASRSQSATQSSSFSISCKTTQDCTNAFSYFSRVSSGVTCNTATNKCQFQ